MSLFRDTWRYVKWEFRQLLEGMNNILRPKFWFWIFLITSGFLLVFSGKRYALMSIGMAMFFWLWKRKESGEWKHGYV